MANVVVTMDAREAALFRAQQKILDKQIQLNEKLKESEKVSDRAGKTAERGYKRANDAADKQQGTVTKLTLGVAKYAAGVGALSTSVDLLRKAWEQVVKEQERGLAALQATQTADRSLLQISANAEEFQQLRGQADTLSQQFGVDRNVVRNVIFSAVSEGFQDAVPGIIAAAQVIAPESAATVAGQVPALFKGQVGALEAVDLTLKAAQASRLNFEQISRSLPGAAEGGGIAKATVEETLAVLSVLASEFKSGDTAADRIKAFATASGLDPQLQGQGIVAVVEQLMSGTKEAREEFLGSSQELNAAFLKMSENLPLIKQRIEEIAAERAAFATGGGLLAQQTAIALNDPRLTALRNQASAEQSLANAEATVSGISGAIASGGAAMATEFQLRNSGLGVRTAGGLVNRSAAAFASAVGADQATSAAFAQQVASGVSQMMFGPFMKDLFKLQSDATANLKAASEDLRKTSGNLRGNTGNAAARAQAAGVGGG